MNFKQTAKKLEQYLQEELIKIPPILQMPNGSLIYNNFIIKKNKNYQWELKRPKGYVLDTFHLKINALNASKFYNSGNFKKYNEIKILDNLYAKTYDDASRYKYRYKSTTDPDMKTLYLARYTESKSQVDYAKFQIVKQLNSLF